MPDRSPHRAAISIVAPHNTVGPLTQFGLRFAADVGFRGRPSGRPGLPLAPAWGISHGMADTEKSGQSAEAAAVLDLEPTEYTSAEDRDRLLQSVEEALDDYRLKDVEELLEPLHAADLAELLQALTVEDRRTVVGLIRNQLAVEADVLAYLDEEIRDEIVALLEPHEVAAALEELETDDAVYLIQDLDEEDRQTILKALRPETRLMVEEALGYPEYSAGRLMQRDMVVVPQFWTVGKVIDYLRAETDLPDDFYLIFVADTERRPVGSILLSRVLRSKRSIKLDTLIDEDIRTIPANLDQEAVAEVFRRYALISAPVVHPETGGLLGVITVDDVVDVIDEEAEDDLLKLGGVQRDDIYSAALSVTRSRFSWLLVNLGTAVLAAAVIALFEATIEQAVALAVLMPIVASMGGNAGTQTLTVTVRGIATGGLGDRAARRLITKEIIVGMLNGILFAAIAGGLTYLWARDVALAGVIAMAMVVTMIVAGISGTLIPLALDRLKVDPAIASGVFLTTVTDVVGFFAFLGLAAWILL